MVLNRVTCTSDSPKKIPSTKSSATGELKTSRVSHAIRITVVVKSILNHRRLHAVCQRLTYVLPASNRRKTQPGSSAGNLPLISREHQPGTCRSSAGNISREPAAHQPGTSAGNLKSPKLLILRRLHVIRQQSYTSKSFRALRRSRQVHPHPENKNAAGPRKSPPACP
jgi:hypothetical protein